MKKTACYALTAQGARLAQRLAEALDGDLFAPERRNIAGARGFRSLPALTAETFRAYRAHIFVGAAGIVLRCIAPHLGHKSRDPAVLVCDQRGKNVISLLSGHPGGANALAERVAALSGGRAVITTATDTEGLPALDLLAKEAGCTPVDPAEFTALQSALLDGEPVFLADPRRLFPAPEECLRVERIEDIPAGSFHIIVDHLRHPPCSGRLRLAAPPVYAGVGCRKGVPAEDILAALDAALDETGLERAALAGLASATLKEHEAGLLEAARRLGLPVRFFDAGQITETPVPHPCSKAGKILGTPPTSVCEASALLAAGPGAALLSGKRIYRSVTAAFAASISAPLRIIGIGPGDMRHMSADALAGLAASRVIIGYSLYLNLIPQELRRGKECLAGNMRREKDRCNAAVDAARAGKPTALVCSGDAGIYGMAGLVFELLEQRGLMESIAVEVIPGIPALCAAAALLGAPLMHDFACVSLSDLLTPWELIIRRVEAALRADFVLALYNPRSKGRPAHLETVIDSARRERDPRTPVGLARQAYREGQTVDICDLSAFDASRADMLSLVIIGNTSTRRIGNKMVTPRGYCLGQDPVSSQAPFS